MVNTVLAITRESDFSWRCGLRRIRRHLTLHNFKQIIIYIYGQDFEKKLEKPDFWPIYGTFFKILGKSDFFRKIRLCHFSTFIKLLTSCKKSGNSYDPIPRKTRTDVRTYGRRRIHRTFMQAWVQFGKNRLFFENLASSLF